MANRDSEFVWRFMRPSRAQMGPSRAPSQWPTRTLNSRGDYELVGAVLRSTRKPRLVKILEI